MSVAEDLIKKAESRDVLFGIIGLGYVGLPLAVELAQAGYRVLGFDVSQRVVDGLNNGRSHVKDVPDAQLKEIIASGRFTATWTAASCARRTRFRSASRRQLSKFMIPMSLHRRRHRHDQEGAPVRPGDRPRKHHVSGNHARDHATGARIHRTQGRQGFLLAFSPERVDPGNPVYQTKNTLKVVGGITEDCRRVVCALYQPAIDSLVPVSTTEAAELVKLLENTFRA